MMNKNEYIKELSSRLRYLPKEEKEDAIAYYTEYLGEMEISDTDDVSDKIGSPKEVAKEILDNCTVKAIKAQKESKSVKDSGKVAWLVILGILSLPLSLPIAIVVAAVTFALLIVAFALIFAFVAVAVALVLGGFVGIGCSLFTPGIASKAVSFGTSLAIIGVGVLMLVGTIELFKLIIRLLGKIAIKKKNVEE